VPPIDLVITLCGSAASETCPVFPGNPLRAHWGLPDPAAVNGDGAAVDTAFAQTRAWLDIRIGALLDLPFEMMERAALLARLAAIGQMEGAV
jgi:arsenate reductase